MKNRSWGVCLLLAGLVGMPDAAAACAIAEDEDDECAEYVWGYNEEGVRVSGTRVGDSGTARESLSLDAGIDGVGINAGVEGTLEITYSYAAYTMSDGTTRILNCVTYEEILDD